LRACVLMSCMYVNALLVFIMRKQPLLLNMCVQTLQHVNMPD